MAFERDEIILSHGKRLAYSDTLAGTYTEVFGTVDIQLPERELEEEEVTNDDSPDYTKDFEPGLYDPGSVAFTYKYTRSQFTVCEALFALAADVSTRDEAVKFWKITLPDGSTGIFQGYIKSHNLPLEGASVPTVEAEIRCKSKLTWAAGS